MRCRKARRLIQEWLNRELDASQQAKLEDHITRCPSCRIELESFDHLRPLLTQLQTPAPPTMYWSSLHSSVLGKLSTPPLITKSRGAWYRPVMWAGTASACTFVIGLFMGSVLFGGTGNDAALHRTIAQSRRNHELHHEHAQTVRRIQRDPIVTHSTREQDRSSNRMRPQRLTKYVRANHKGNSQKRTSLIGRMRPPRMARNPRANVLAVYNLASPAIGFVAEHEKETNVNTDEPLPGGTIVAPVAQRVFAPIKYVVVATGSQRGEYR